MHPFALQFRKADVRKWASRYSYAGENRVERKIGPAAKRRGYFTKPEFLALCYWKTPRTQARVDANSAAAAPASGFSAGASRFLACVGPAFFV